MALIRNRDYWFLYLAPIAAFLALFFLYPFINGIIVSLHPQDAEGWSIANYVRFFSDPKMLRILRFTAIDLGIPATAISLLLAIGITYKLRKPFFGSTFLRSTITLPLAYSGVIAVSVIFIFFSGAGLFNRFLVALGLIDRPLRLMGNYWGVLIASVYQQIPFLFLFLISAMVAIPPTLEEAAKTLGATEWQVFRRVILPLIMPAIVTAGVLGYITNYGAFVTALIPGDPAFRTRTILIEAYYQAFQKGDWSMAITVSLIAAAVEMIFIFLYLRLQRRWQT